MFSEQLPVHEENDKLESRLHWQATALVEYELSLGNGPDLWDLFTYQPDDKRLFYNRLLSTFPGYVSVGHETSVRDDLEKEVISIMSGVTEEEGEANDILWAARLHGASTMAEALDVTIIYNRNRLMMLTDIQLANGKTPMEELLSKDIHSLSGIDGVKREVTFFSLLNEVESIVESQNEHLG